MWVLSVLLTLFHLHKLFSLGHQNTLQACEGGLKHKSELVNKLEEKTNQLVATLKDMEKRSVTA